MAVGKFARGLSGESERAHRAGNPEISKRVIWCQGYIGEVANEYFNASLVSQDGDLYQSEIAFEHLEPRELEMVAVGRFITAEFFEVNPDNVFVLSMSADLLTADQMDEASRSMQAYKARLEQGRAYLRGIPN